ERAHLAHQADDPEEHALIEHTLAITPLPADLEQRLQFALGDLVATNEPEVARAAFERCATLAGRFAPHCAIRNAEIELARGLPTHAVAALAPYLSTDPPARVVAGETMLALDDPTLPETIAPWTRASLFALGAERLAASGLIARAHAW